MRQAFGIVHVFITRETPEHGLAQQTGQQVAGVLARAAFRQDIARQISEAERIVQFTVDQDAGIGGDATSMEVEPQAAVKIDPQGTVIRFTRWVFHEPAAMTTATR